MAERARAAVWGGLALGALILLVVGGRSLIFLPVLAAACIAAQAAVVRWLLRDPGQRHPPASASPGEVRHDALVERVLVPFLHRCRRAPPADIADAPSRPAVAFMPGWEAVEQVFVPPEDSRRLAQTLASHRVVFPGAEVPREGLVALTLAADRATFRTRLVAAVGGGATAVRVYADQAPRDDRWLPFLEEWMDGSASRAELLRAVGMERERSAQQMFERDLDKRRGVGGEPVTVAGVDRLTGYGFQALLGMMFEARGYRIVPTPLSGDQGADVLAERGAERLVVQAKHREAHGEGSISNSAVQEVIAAQGHYGATRAVLLTNHAWFSRSAEELARRCGVELWGRERLAALIEEFNGQPKDYRRLSEVLAQVRPSVPGATARPTTDEQ